MKKERMIITGSEGLIGASVSSYMKDLYKTKKISLRFGHDLTDEIFVKEWFSQNKAEYLVNCFALNDHVYNNKENKTLFDVSLDSVSKYLLVNVVSMFSVCREFAKSQDAKGISKSLIYLWLLFLPKKVSLWRVGEAYWLFFVKFCSNKKQINLPK